MSNCTPGASSYKYTFLQALIDRLLGFYNCLHLQTIILFKRTILQKLLF